MSSSEDDNIMPYTFTNDEAGYHHGTLRHNSPSSDSDRISRHYAEIDALQETLGVEERLLQRIRTAQRTFQSSTNIGRGTHLIHNRPRVINPRVGTHNQALFYEIQRENKTSKAEQRVIYNKLKHNIPE